MSLGDMARKDIEHEIESLPIRKNESAEDLAARMFNIHMEVYSSYCGRDLNTDFYLLPEEVKTSWIEKARHKIGKETETLPNFTTRAIDFFDKERDYPDHIRALVGLLTEARAQGRQEGFAEARERAVALCNQKAINCERRATGYTNFASINSAKDKQISFEEARDDIRDLQPKESGSDDWDEEIALAENAADEAEYS